MTPHDDAPLDAAVRAHALAEDADGTLRAPGGLPVLGARVDAQTRCVHYRTARDVVALRLACCAAYWPCHLCHAEAAGHAAVPVPAEAAHLPHVLCGVCGSEHSVTAYRRAMAAASPACPTCAAPFNPGCAAHAHLYFAPGAGA